MVSDVQGAGFVTSSLRILLSIPAELHLLPHYNELKLAEIPLQKSLSGLMATHSLLHSDFISCFPPKAGTELSPGSLNLSAL